MEIRLYAPNYAGLTICNAFSLQMLPTEESVAKWMVSVTPLTEAEARQRLADAAHNGEYIFSAVGHADTAAIIGGIIGTEVPLCRASVSVEGDHEILVAQYCGPRLPEGTTTLPAGASIRWYHVTAEPVVRPATCEWFAGDE